MMTREIWHEILINASPADLYDAVTDVKKLAHWWTTDVRGESATDKQLEFWFSGFRAAVMEVSESRVCQLHSQAVARLRARLREQAWVGAES